MIALTCAACSGESYPDNPRVEIGSPLPGLSTEELARFRQGEALFNHVFTPEEGLGPLFNENACNACHTSPVSGGTGEQFLRKATRFTTSGTCNLLSNEGGENLQQQATPLLMAHGIEERPVPASATQHGRFSVPFLFGLGLVEAIPDETILARADPNDADGDGISGRGGRTEDGRLARFGRKAEFVTILDFVDTALHFEMGLTTPLHPSEQTLNGVPFPPGTDPAPDPEIDRNEMELLRDYVRFLAAPSRGIPPDSAERETVRRGERLFHEIGCASCHVPSMKTGPSEIEALDRKTVYLYSDLLLHDMGPGLADVCGITATPSELRTEMLMGLRHRDVFLHNGQAFSVRKAIELHGGEAEEARNAFLELGLVAQDAIFKFLDTL